MGQIANPAARTVLQALAEEQWDFRTIDGVSKETGLDPEQIKRILQSYPELVRRSLVRDKRGRSLYTLRGREMKSQEKKAFLRLLFTKMI